MMNSQFMPQNMYYGQMIFPSGMIPNYGQPMVYNQMIPQNMPYMVPNQPMPMAYQNMNCFQNNQNMIPQNQFNQNPIEKP